MALCHVDILCHGAQPDGGACGWPVPARVPRGRGGAGIGHPVRTRQGFDQGFL